MAPPTYATPPRTRSEVENEEERDVLIVQKCLTTLILPRAVLAAKAHACFAFPITLLPIYLVLPKMSPQAKPSRKTRSRRLMIKVEERTEEEVEEVREIKEQPNANEKVPLLSLTYCWPLIPYTKPNFIQSAFTALALPGGESEITLSTRSNLIHPQGAKESFQTWPTH